MLEKLKLFHLTCLIILPIDLKMGCSLGKNHFLRCLGCPSLLNWIWVLALSILLKLPPRKLEPSFVLCSFRLQRLLFISINVSDGPAWNAVIFGLLLLTSTWIYYINYRNAYVEQLVLHFTSHCWSIASFRIFLSYYFYFGRCSFELAKLVPLRHSCGKFTRYMNFLSRFFDFIRMSLSRFSFLAQLDSGILCL